MNNIYLTDQKDKSGRNYKKSRDAGSIAAGEVADPQSHLGGGCLVLVPKRTRER